MDKDKNKLYNREGRPYTSSSYESKGPNLSQFFISLGTRLKGLFTHSPQKQPSQNKKKSTKKRKISFRWVFLKVFISLFIWGACAGVLGVLWFSYDLPNIEKLQLSVRKPGVTIQAADGSIIGTYGDLYEDMVKISQLPSYVPQAVMSIEDRRFYYHFGVDVIGLIRAAYTNYKAERVVQGGSTLTQQLAKNFLMTQGMYDNNDRSLRRKIQEVILAIWLESKFTKEQILTIYLNRVYFGAGTYGIDAAARKYFHKPARLLTVYEAAVIAGLLKAPSKYSPAHHPVRARQRATLVLAQMAEEGYISSAAEYLKQQDDHAQTTVIDDQGSRFFADWAYETIPSLIGDYDQDLVVITTLDLRIQKHAEEATKKMMGEMGAQMKASEISLVAMTPQGAVKSMIGGVSYGKSQFNRSTQALRQPGSAFKPFVYLAALEAGYTPQSMVSDEPVSIGKWSPKNFRKYQASEDGEISLMQALTKSVNTVTVRLAQQVGGAKIAHVAQRLGITSEMMTDLSIALGTTEVTLVELVSAYATFANKGHSVWPYCVVEIRNRAGEILYQRQDVSEAPVIAEKNVHQMVTMLTSVIDHGTGRAAKLSVPVAGKTGSNADKDAWFVGFTSELVAGVWVGNDNPRISMKKESTGGRLPAKTWAEFMKAVIVDNPPQKTTLLAGLNHQENMDDDVATILENGTGQDADKDDDDDDRRPKRGTGLVVAEEGIPEEDTQEFEQLVGQLSELAVDPT